MNSNGKVLTRQYRRGTFLSHTAKVSLAILLLRAHACCIICTRATWKATKEAAVLGENGFSAGSSHGTLLRAAHITVCVAILLFLGKLLGRGNAEAQEAGKY